MLARRSAGSPLAPLKLLRQRCGTEIIGYVKQIHKLYAGCRSAHRHPGKHVRGQQALSRCMRCRADDCPDRLGAAAGDSLGGVVEVVVRQVPIGLGEPVFDKLGADLAKAPASLPSLKGFEIGSGFAGTTLTGRNTMIRMRCAMGISTRAPITPAAFRRYCYRRTHPARGCFQTHRDHRQAARHRYYSAATTLAAKRATRSLCAAAPCPQEARVALVLADHYLRHKAQQLGVEKRYGGSTRHRHAQSLSRPGFD